MTARRKGTTTENKDRQAKFFIIENKKVVELTATVLLNNILKDAAFSNSKDKYFKRN